MIIKTEELFLDFLNQLKNVCFQKTLYESDMENINLDLWVYLMPILTNLLGIDQNVNQLFAK